MIDPLAEELFTLSAAAARVRRQGRRQKRLHPSTLFRWSRYGIRGVRLETVRVGATMYTSDGALRAFFAALNEPRDEPIQPNVDENRQAAVERQLAEAGI